MTADASTAWRRPSRDAPIVYSMRAGVRKPAASVLLAAAVHEPHGPAGAARELGRQDPLRPDAELRAEPAAHELADHADALGIELERLGDGRAGVVDGLGRAPEREPVLAPVGDGGVRLHRVVELGGREVLGLDLDLGRRQRRVGVAALVLGRVHQEVLPLERLVDVRDEPEHLVRGRERRERRARRRRRCRRRQRRSRRRRSRGRRSAASRRRSGPSPGPSTQRTPGTARAASRSSDVTLALACGLRRTAASSRPGSATSTVKRAVPVVRARAVILGVGSPIGWVALPSSNSGVSSSSTSVQRTSVRPSTTASVLTSLAVIRPPPRLATACSMPS